MSLINDIRSAQVAAAEDAITKNLESMGIVTPERQRELGIIELARQDPRIDDDLEIDSDPKVSEGDDNGAWVAAWLWVDFSGTPLDKDEITEEYVGHLSPEELAKDRELVAAALENREECKMNPLYTAYAKSHGMSEDEVLACDQERYPGGCMTGFIFFVADMKRKFWEVRPEAFCSASAEYLFNVDAFHRFVVEQVK